MLSREDGNVMVIVVLAMVVLIGFTALAVDGGYLYSRHTWLQDVDDAVTLAAAHGIVQTGGNSESNKKKAAFREATEYLEKNNFSVDSKDDYLFEATVSKGSENGTMKLYFPDGISKVKVELGLNCDLYFARVLGENTALLTVNATARIGQAGTQTGGLIPVGIVANDPLHPDEGWVTGQHYEMTLGPSFGSSGNYGYLDFSPPNMFNEYLEYGYDQTLEVGEIIDTYTGVNVGLVANALSSRVAADTCTIDNYTTHEGCPRLVYTPIVDRIGEIGSSEVQIVGFAAFFLEGYLHQGNDIILAGQFVGIVSSAEIGQSYLGYAVQSVRLIE